MKKMLALAVLAALGVSACSNQHKNDENSYHGTVLFSQYEGENLKLTVRKDNCEADKRDTATEDVVVTQKYDSDIVVGACVKVTDNGSDNVSRSVSRSWLSRTGIFH